MEQKTNRLLEKAMRIMGKDSDVLIISHKDGQCSGVVHGNADNIAQAIFSCLHQPDNPIGDALYRLIKLNVLNILANPSPYAIDLTEAITNVIPKGHE